MTKLKQPALVFKAKALALCIAYASLVEAKPENPRVVEGQATFSENGGNFTVEQQSQAVLIDYRDFSIGANEQVQFVQPSSSSVAVNRVTGANPSEILGSLKANGQVFLINPNGVIFSPGAHVDVGALAVSTLPLEKLSSDAVHLGQAGSADAAAIENFATISADSRVAFISPNLSNHGQISAGDTVEFIATDKAIVHFGGALTGVESDVSRLPVSIENSGTINAQHIVLDAKTASNVQRSVINNSGAIEAEGIAMVGGSLRLVGGDVLNSGTLASDASAQGHAAGSVDIDAQRFVSSGAMHARAVGSGDGGSILVNTEELLLLSAGAEVDVSATGDGHGGSALFVSEVNAAFAEKATISARGGSDSGDGGEVEFSGKSYVDALGQVDTRAMNSSGKTGSYLIDPTDIVISDEPSSGGNFEGTNFNWRPSGDVSVINVQTIENNLRTSDVRIDTNSGFAGNGDITVDAAIDLNGSGNNALTLSATRDLNFSENGALVDSDPSTLEMGGSINLNAGRDIRLHERSTINVGASTLALIANRNVIIPGAALMNVGQLLIQSASFYSPTGDTVLIQSSLDNAWIQYRVHSPTQDVSLNLSSKFTSAQFVHGSNTALSIATGADSFRFDTLELGGGDLRLMPAGDLQLPNISSVNNFSLIGTGRTVLPSSLSAAGDLTIEMGRLADGDGGSLQLAARHANIELFNPDGDLLIDSDFDSLQLKLGGEASASINNRSALTLQDKLTQDRAIDIAQGNFELQVDGSLDVVNDIVVRDAQADGVREALIDIVVNEGDIELSNPDGELLIFSDGVDQGAGGGIGAAADSQLALSIRHSDGSSDQSDIIIGNDTHSSFIHARGGDIEIISNGEIQAGDLTQISAYNSAPGATGGTVVNDSASRAQHSAESARSVTLKQALPYIVVPTPSPSPTPTPSPSPTPTPSPSPTPTPSPSPTPVPSPSPTPVPSPSPTPVP
ncbi:filamentous hemagglutinin N-terminal domain-containing protein, partial [Agaribacterium haliotis]|uniref:two-partner secretion domain-containing protein n=1 Tax=Agaribacterium haliotis TaxID=2013869 RepID=UPI0011779FF7